MDLLQEVLTSKAQSSPEVSSDDKFTDILGEWDKEAAVMPDRPTTGLVHSLLFGSTSSHQSNTAKLPAGPKILEHKHLIDPVIKVKPIESEGVIIVRQQLKEMKIKLAEKIDKFLKARKEEETYLQSIVQVQNTILSFDAIYAILDHFGAFAF